MDEIKLIIEKLLKSYSKNDKDGVKMQFQSLKSVLQKQKLDIDEEEDQESRGFDEQGKSRKIYRKDENDGWRRTDEGWTRRDISPSDWANLLPRTKSQ